MGEVATSREVVRGATSSNVGVVLVRDGDESGDIWLKPASWVARTWVDVSAVRDRLVEANRATIESMSIDYGSDLGLCEGVWEEQAEFARWALAELGVHDRRQFSMLANKGVLAGPGSVYHVDQGFGCPTALFVVTSVLGGGVLHFPQIGLELSLEQGQTVLFDGLQVHGVRPSQGGPVGAQPFMVVSSEVLVNEQGADRLGLVSRGVPKEGVDLADAVVDTATGVVALPEYG